MYYPGQRVQIDVKFVPACCMVNEAKGKKFYQYTALHEYSRWRYVEAFEEHSTYSYAQFLKHLIQRFPQPIECIQTDNGMEFTKRFSTSGEETLTLFQRVLKEQGICHKLIRPFTPRNNGKVERSHRKDNERFMHLTRFIPLRTFPGICKSTTAGTIISSLCVR
ncbi:DDE-type integrase/transposase/recombinase [Sellimonas intestinalis]|uniref:DDE-type integrase/transposase/recombinase n=1 Tax=Sellimonas intestinalis TaxID=1653434 RepID=UPI002ED27AD9